MPLRRIDFDNRTEGLRSMRQGLVELSSGSKRAARSSLQSALRPLVEAFLEDRRRNARLFVLAHRVGQLIEQEWGCEWTHDEQRDTYTNDCPIYGLHSRLGLSIAGFSTSECSICGAGDLLCDHVPGEEYDGQQCIRTVTNLELDHVALTPNPDFAYTFIQSEVLSRAQVEERLGIKLRPGIRVLSHHCRDCYGCTRVEDEDIDPTMWPSLLDEESAE